MDPADEADLNEAIEAFELADINPRGGISKWVGVMLNARDRAQEPDDECEKTAENMPESMPVKPRAPREATPFERALLGGMARKPMYGGTVEPWRVEERRRRNRAARRARRANRLAAKR
jgi:hypothetical protein